MKAVKSAVLCVSMLLSVAMVSDAFARGSRGHGHHGHHRHSGVRLGVVIGLPLLWHYSSPYAYPHYSRPYPYPYYPPTVVVPAEPREYIERDQAAPTLSAPPASAYWHYCAESRSYYPYVKECAGPWQRVAPLPPPS